MYGQPAVASLVSDMILVSFSGLIKLVIVISGLAYGAEHIRIDAAAGLWGAMGLIRTCDYSRQKRFNERRLCYEIEYAVLRRASLV